MKELTEAQFLKDVADHQLTIQLDSGLHRCLRFVDKSGSSNLYFNLTTWPGRLAISGDMGTFVFNRLPDMFEFFRTSPDKERLYVNLGYWAEKCEAADRRTGGLDAYDEDLFKACIGQRFNDHEFDSKEQKARCWEQIKDKVLIAENEYEAFQYAGRFQFEGFEFSDFWETRLRSYTYQYQWCCYAIAWGIRQYDLAQVSAPVKAMAG